jgi:hypothetical protein
VAALIFLEDNYNSYEVEFLHVEDRVDELAFGVALYDYDKDKVGYDKDMEDT